MSEKKGHTVKLKFDFPEQLCCEVYVPNLEDWFRTTSNEFRSWVGKRRILKFEGKLGSEERTSYYEEYNGPTYLFGTNKKINTTQYQQDKVAFVNNSDPREFKRRPYEQI